MSLTFGDGRVIYYNPHSLQIIGAHWVADGWEVLVDHPDGADAARPRRGTALARQQVNSSSLARQMAGCQPAPRHAAVIEVVHRTLTNLDGTVMARFNQPSPCCKRRRSARPLTRRLSADVPSPVSRITCPDTLPPRLFAGGKGRVISGGINLRREPSLSGEQRITWSPIKCFDVIGGPNCDPTGIAWWEVGIGGLRGWMAESKDGVYLLEPVLQLTPHLKRAR